jgi:hypothetical protein
MTKQSLLSVCPVWFCVMTLFGHDSSHDFSGAARGVYLNSKTRLLAFYGASSAVLRVVRVAELFFVGTGAQRATAARHTVKSQT